MKLVKISLTLTIAFAFLMHSNIHAQFSRYVDFDGSGHGTLYSSSSAPIPQGVCVSGCDGPLGIPSGKNQQSYNNQVQALNQQRLDQQLQEQKNRIREKEINDSIDRIKNIKSLENLQELQRLQEELKKFSKKDARIQYNLKSRISDSLSEFERQQRIFKIRQNELLKRISKSILDIKVPTPETPPVYK